MLSGYILCLLIGLCSGGTVACAVAALITSLKIITRLADKAHIRQKVKTLENTVILGTGICNALYLLGFKPLCISRLLSYPFLLLMGTGFGIYVGCLVTSLGETLGITAIITRRLKIRTAHGIMIFSIAVGKLIGSLIYFICGVN